MWQRLRSVILEAAAQKAVDSYVASLDRFEEAWLALEWLLARAPDRGYTRMPEDSDDNGFPDDDEEEIRLYVQAADEIALTPEIWVLFSYDRDEVVILAVKAVKTP